MAEFDIIARYFAPIAGAAGLGLLDDAALLEPTLGHDLVVTTDAVVAGVHFFADDPPASIAHKALATNLSDLAAKGATPRAFLLTLMLPGAGNTGINDAWLAAFASGLGTLAAQSGCMLVGGDTVSTPGPLALSITAIGAVPSGTMVRRGAARAGDFLYVTGTIGDAAIGLQRELARRAGADWPLAEDHLSYLSARYRLPRARLAVAATLRQHASAAMDISDGFAGDLIKMISLAGYGADVFLADVPLSVATRAAIRHKPDLRDTALTGGDDYELLIAVPSSKAKTFQAECLAKGVAVSRVGIVTDRQVPVRFLEADGSERTFRNPSYVHG